MTPESEAHESRGTPGGRPGGRRKRRRRNRKEACGGREWGAVRKLTPGHRVLWPHGGLWLGSRGLSGRHPTLPFSPPNFSGLWEATQKQVMTR